jgi:hypothetical protein
MKITFTEQTEIPAGVALRLTLEQMVSLRFVIEPYDSLKLRSSQVAIGKPLGDESDVYVGIQALQFEAGETVDIVGDLPKGILPIYDQQQGLLSDDKIDEIEFTEQKSPPKRKPKKIKQDELPNLPD